jgi:hypothetical protein
MCKNKSGKMRAQHIECKIRTSDALSLSVVCWRISGRMGNLREDACQSAVQIFRRKSDEKDSETARGIF